MKIVAIGSVQNEADIIGATTRHLFDQGVDELILTDHRSTDETPKILQELAEEYGGRVLLRRDEREKYHAAEMATSMADEARAHGADWIVPFDADEFWVPANYGTLRESLAAVDPSVDTIVGRIYQHRDWWNRGAKPLGVVHLVVRGDAPRAFGRGYRTTNPPAVKALEDVLEVRDIPFRGETHFYMKRRARIATMTPDNQNQEYRACLEPGGFSKVWEAFKAAPCVLDPIRSARYVEVPGVQRPAVMSGATTSVWHMQQHEMPVPRTLSIASVGARCWRVAVEGVSGKQHNPCVFTWNDRLHTIVRVLDGHKTENYLAEVSDGGGLVHARRLVPEGHVLGTMRGSQKVQLEDLRVFENRGKFYALAAGHPGSTPARDIRQVLLEITESGAIVSICVFESNRNEKNWMPCPLKEGGFRIVYSIDPLIVYDGERYPVACTAAATGPQRMGYIRGGSQLVPYKDGWLAVVHQVYRPRKFPQGHNFLMWDFHPPVQKDPVAGDEPVVYLHRFARFSKEFEHVHLSREFHFVHIGIEFCAGLTWNDRGKLVASFGLADREAWLAEFDSTIVEHFFS